MNHAIVRPGSILLGTVPFNVHICTRQPLPGLDAARTRIRPREFQFVLVALTVGD